MRDPSLENVEEHYDSPLERLQLLGSDDEAIAMESFARLSDAGREVIAIDLARRVLARGGMHELRCRVAERLDARGDEEGARALLEPLERDPEAPLDGWMLAAEIAERRGDGRGALSLYERVVARDLSDVATVERVVGKREGKVYVDFGQNRRGQTIVPPYVPRPVRGATVSTPLAWDELDDDLRPSRFTIQTVGQRLDTLGDLFAPLLADPQDLLPAIEALRSRLV